MNDILAPADPLAWNFYRNPRQPYDDFFPNYILKPLSYSFVRRTHNRLIVDFSRELPDLMHRMTTVFGGETPGWFPSAVDLLVKAGVTDLYDFIDLVPTRSQAQAFIRSAGVPQPALMGLVDYFKQWWFPFPATLRQLIDLGDAHYVSAVAALKYIKIANSMSLLEAAACEEERTLLSGQTGVAPEILSDLVHRADVSRLPYVSGGAVNRLWAMGYSSFHAIRAADPQEYKRRVDEYFQAGGKGSAFDAQMPNILSFLQDARHAPLVLS